MAFKVGSTDLRTAETGLKYKILREQLEANMSGELWVWGLNSVGQLGVGDIIDRSSPVQVGVASYWKTYVDSQGRLFMWGRNDQGQLGDGTILPKSSPVQIGALSNWKQVVTTPEVTAGSTAAIKTDGTLWTWGDNTNGKLGSGTILARSSPVQVGSLTNWKQVSIGNSLLAVKSDGSLWACGFNLFGPLGLGDVLARSSPVQVGSLANWKSVVVASSSTFAIKTDGTLWAWGLNTQGQLGLGDTISRSSPVQVGSLTNWKSVAGGWGGSIAAIKTDGTLWTWGVNNVGQLALGDVINRSSPVQVGLLNNWKSAIAGEQGFSAAIKTDGTLWTWGYATSGFTGLGDTISRSSPVQVGSFTDWKDLNQTGAIRYGIQ